MTRFFLFFILSCSDAGFFFPSKRLLASTPFHALDKVILLDLLDFSKYFLIKESPIYRVYYDDLSDSYVKTWEPVFNETPLVRKKYFLEAYQKNFFEGIAQISALIFDKKNRCRGYITPNLSDKEIIMELQIENKKFVDSRKNHIKFNELISKLEQKVVETDYFYFDLNRGNLVSDGRDLFLVDLNSVAPLHVLNESVIREKLKTLLPSDYYEFLINLCDKKYRKKVLRMPR